jgi:hypothetical protein
LNPYDAPATLAEAGPALPSALAPTLRAALTVIAIDFGRGLTWRLATGIATAMRGTFLDGTDHFNPNILIQLAFGVAMVFAIAMLTRQRDAAPRLRRAAIATAIAAVSMYVTRFLVVSAAGVMAVPRLELATVTLDAAAVVLAALYLAAAFGEVGAAFAQRRVKTLAAVYVAAVAAALAVVADLTNGRQGFLPPAVGGVIRSLATLVFIALGIGSYVFVKRLARRATAAG